MNKNISVLAIVIILLIGGFFLFKGDSEKTTTNEEEFNGAVEEMVYEYSGDLEDVIGGNASGIAQAIFEDGVYNLRADFTNLPEPEGTDFYEGWIVRTGENMDVISTGKAVKVDGVYSNTFTYPTDITDHLFYVLTIEPDDGDPAPADHVLEGTLSK